MSKDAVGDASISNKENIVNLIARIKNFQEPVRKHIKKNYIEFLPNNTNADLYLEQAEMLSDQTKQLLQSIADGDAVAELHECQNELREVSMALDMSYRILKIDDLFQCIDEANSTKDYLLVLDLLCKMRNLIYNESVDELEHMFKSCECYDHIQVKYNLQSHILKQNLQQRFEQLVQLTEKPLSQAKCVTLQVSKNADQLQDVVVALFQVRYKPNNLCNFLYENFFKPLIVNPVLLIEHSEENAEYVQLTLTYSIKDMTDDLRPGYKQVFEYIKILLHSINNINVCVRERQHFFSVIGDYIKQPLLELIVEQCLMHTIPDTIEEYQQLTVIKDVLEFEEFLADVFFINSETDRSLTEFCNNFEIYFRNRFFKTMHIKANVIMYKGLQDMTVVAEKVTPEDLLRNVLLFPRCMISKSTLEIIKLLARVFHRSKLYDNVEEDDKINRFNGVIAVLLNFYIVQVPKIHEKQLESMPQVTALFHNNCQFLAHWVAINCKNDIPTFSALVKTLQSAGTKYLNVQIAFQQKQIMDILKRLDLSTAHELVTRPRKLIRQCLRQLDLLRNVWQNVLPDSIYCEAICELLNGFCHEIIVRIQIIKDISAKLANELSDLIKEIFDKAPTLLKEQHDVINIKCWMKLQQLKIILNSSLIEITELWGKGAGPLTANFEPAEVKQLIRNLFENTDRRAKALITII